MTNIETALSARPDLGVLIPHSGGLRKVRCSVPGRGKRGGARAIYCWAVAENQISTLFVYPKSEKDDLTVQQLKALREIIEKEFK